MPPEDTELPLRSPPRGRNHKKLSSPTRRSLPTMHVNPDDHLGKKEIFVGGKWVLPAEGKYLTAINPATEGTIGFIGERTQHRDASRPWRVVGEASCLPFVGREPVLRSVDAALTGASRRFAGAATAADVPLIMETATEAFKVLLSF